MNSNDKVEELVSKLGESVVTAINEAHRRVLTEAVSAESEITLRDALRKVLVECGYTQAPDDFKDVMVRGARRVSLEKIVGAVDPQQALYEALQYPATATDTREVHRLAGQVVELQDALEKSCDKYKQIRTALFEHNVQVERLCRLCHLPPVITPPKAVVDKVQDNIKQYGEFVVKLARALGWSTHAIKLDDLLRAVKALVRWKQEAHIMLSKWDVVHTLVLKDPSLTVGDSVVDKAISIIRAHGEALRERDQAVSEVTTLKAQCAGLENQLDGARLASAQWQAEAERWRNLVTVQNGGMRIVSSAQDIPYQELPQQATAGLTFEEALTAMKGGAKVRRSEWPVGEYHVMKNGRFELHTGQPLVGIYTEHALATDWEIIP